MLYAFDVVASTPCHQCFQRKWREPIHFGGSDKVAHFLQMKGIWNFVCESFIGFNDHRPKIINGDSIPRFPFRCRSLATVQVPVGSFVAIAWGCGAAFVWSRATKPSRHKQTKKQMPQSVPFAVVAWSAAFLVLFATSH